MLTELGIGTDYTRRGEVTVRHCDFVSPQTRFTMSIENFKDDKRRTDRPLRPSTLPIDMSNRPAATQHERRIREHLGGEGERAHIGTTASMEGTTRISSSPEEILALLPFIASSPLADGAACGDQTAVAASDFILSMGVGPVPNRHNLPPPPSRVALRGSCLYREMAVLDPKKSCQADGERRGTATTILREWGRRTSCLRW
ncbi:hypothetical protein NMY22_g16559 [Coprinellus aureogranulatus]|nr:hypothetical protein NMY22_g16559 [Coprinellus aureogranulatus]